jgi:hypothetical protein
MTWCAVGPRYGLIIVLAIVDNLAIPIAMAIASPVESARAYDMVTEALQAAAEWAGVELDMRTIPVLGDLHAGLKEHCERWGCPKAECAFHLIRGEGARGHMGRLFRKALYEASERRWYAETRLTLVGDVLELVRSGALEGEDADRFFEFINWDTVSGQFGEFPQALFNRGQIPMCNSHIESAHRHINERIDPRAPLIERLGIVRDYLLKRQGAFNEEYRLHAATRWMDATAERECIDGQFTDTCRDHCGLGECYARRWGCLDFPCPHRRKIQLQFIRPLPIFTGRCPDVIAWRYLASGDVWGFGRDYVVEAESSDDAEATVDLEEGEVALEADDEAAVDLEDNEVALEMAMEADDDDDPAMEGDGGAI